MSLNPLSANPTKSPNTFKQFVGKKPTDCLNVFGDFVGLALKDLVSFNYSSSYTEPSTFPVPIPDEDRK